MKYEKIKFNKIILITTNIILLSIIFIIILSNNKNVKNIISRDINSSYVFTNPILDCENNNQGDESVISSKNLNDKVLQLKSKYSLTHISLYFRDLNNGPWIGINEKEIFSPASLLKVPILIAFLRESERDPSILYKKVLISPSDINQSIHQNITFENLLNVGSEYSLLDVAKSMIDKSDNTGVSVLLRSISSDSISGVFKSIGVPFVDTSTEVNIRVKDYAGFFRVLYNASYLDREKSEMALQILSKVEYTNGLVYSLPQNIKVSHKFGERSIDDTNLQLHDCGIIYYPGKPYILCIMTRGSDFKKQEKAIQELSKYVYDEVDKYQLSTN
jgi:beta-lactamase class A